MAFTLWRDYKRIGYVHVKSSTAAGHFACGAVEFWIQRYARSDHEDSPNDSWAGIHYALDRRFATMASWNTRDLAEAEWNFVLARICADDALRLGWHRVASGAHEVIQHRAIGRDLFVEAPCPFTIGAHGYYSFDGQDEMELSEECRTDILCALEWRHRDASRPTIPSARSLYQSGILGHVYQWSEFSRAFDGLASFPMCLGRNDGIVITDVGRAELRRRLKEKLTSRLSRLVLSPSSATTDEPAYDLFISHASEDKDDLVDPLVNALQRAGLTVWYDKHVLTIGDSLPRKIDEGLSKSRFGLVVLSRAFFAKEWAKRELDGLVSLETAQGRTRILPVWHRLGVDDVRRFSPTLAAKFAISSAEGIDKIVAAVAAKLGSREREIGGPT